MKRLNYFLVFPLLLLILACGENKPKDPEVIEVREQTFQDPEEAMKEWGDAWNSNDPRQIISRTAEDAVLVLNGEEVSKDSIRSFIENAGSAMADLQMNSLDRNSSDRMAYDTGTYTHGYTNDTTTYRGTYTFIWEREGNDPGWQVKVMNISNVHPDYGITENQQ